MLWKWKIIHTVQKKREQKRFHWNKMSPCWNCFGNSIIRRDRNSKYHQVKSWPFTWLNIFSASVLSHVRTKTCHSGVHAQRSAFELSKSMSNEFTIENFLDKVATASGQRQCSVIFQANILLLLYLKSDVARLMMVTLVQSLSLQFDSIDLIVCRAYLIAMNNEILSLSGK